MADPSAYLPDPGTSCSASSVHTLRLAAALFVPRSLGYSLFDHGARSCAYERLEIYLIVLRVVCLTREQYGELGLKILEIPRV